MVKILGLSSLEDQMSKSLWRPEHHQNMNLSSLVHYQNVLKMKSFLNHFEFFLFTHRHQLSHDLLGGGND